MADRRAVKTQGHGTFQGRVHTLPYVSDVRWALGRVGAPHNVSESADTMQEQRRKQIRLPLERYSEPGSIWHVTIDTQGRVPVFADSRVARIVSEEVRHQTRYRDGRLLLYCVMPDHVHAVIQIGSVDLTSIVRSFKAYVSWRCAEAGLPNGFWQPRFHDRGHRESDSLDDLVKYIVENPVKDGLAESWEFYPWIGGDLLERD